MQVSGDSEDPNHVSRLAESKIVLKIGTLAERYCHDEIKGYNECARGRSLSVLWSCRQAYAKSQDCIHQYINDRNVALVKQRWVEAGRPRKADWQALLQGIDTPPPGAQHDQL
ncbi:hypothetical protein V8C86DRAFT_2561150 [Haematococcus lacustris]